MIAAPPRPPGPAGVYLHFPFCASRCSYCDFPTVVGQDRSIDAYLGALEREIASFQREIPDTVDTVYLGGGTPSRMRPDQLERVLAAVRRRFVLAPGTEVTLEANPEDVEPERLRGYVGAGVTRLSLGVQSFDDATLRRVGRGHGVARAMQAALTARDVAGLEVSIDLIAGLPGEPIERWQESIDAAARLGTDHLSLYLLESDKDTPLARDVRRGRTRLCDDDALARLYADAEGRLQAHGFEAYEISNFARGGRVSRHNIKYWTDDWYAGFGLGAHAYLAGRRRGNLTDLRAYLDRIAGGHDPLAHEEGWDGWRRLEEALFLGLRLVRGLDLEQLGERYEVDLRARLDAVWDRAEQACLVVRQGTCVRLTRRGRLCSNSLFVELLERLEGPEPPSSAVS